MPASCALTLPLANPDSGVSAVLPEGLSFFVLAVLAWAFTYALHSTLLLSSAWLVTRRLPDARAGLRERVWKFALVAAFVTASLQVGLGFEPLGGRLPLTRSLATVQAAHPAPSVAGESLPADSPASPFELEPQSPLLWPVWLVRDVLAASAGDTPAFAANQDPAPPAPAAAQAAAGIAQLDAPETAGTADTPDTIEERPAASLFGRGVWAHWAFAACALGTLGGLVLFALLWVRLNGRLRDRIALEHGTLADLLRDLCERSGVRRRVRLSVAPSLGAPISMGLWRPEICVPPRVLLELSVEEQQALLAHELAHVVRRDPLWLAACRLFEGAFFFQPLNRVARREIEDCAEFLSDAWAVRHTGLRFSLASCLTRIAEWIVGDRRSLPAPAMAHGRSRLRHRVELLLEEGVAESVDLRPRWLAPVCLSFGCALVVCVPCVSATEDASPGGDPAGLAMLPETSIDKTEAACPEEHDAQALPAGEAQDAARVDAVGVGFTELEAELAAFDADLALLRAEARGLGLPGKLAREIEAEIAQLEMKLARLRELGSRLESLRASSAHGAATADDASESPTRAARLNTLPTNLHTLFEETSR